ncbi:50S ribosomal protein L34e [Candidatus Woesearchaeota archaeon]|nr:50S ribosomal protein L34e [Candidatus Woesearchaeota archaeon]
MVKPRYRSRTFRRVFVKTPGGEVKLHYRRRRNAAPQCSDCGANLPGVARGTPAQVNKLPRSSRRPERPYGGKLCSKCTRRTIIAQVRKVSA